MAITVSNSYRNRAIKSVAAIDLPKHACILCPYFQTPDVTSTSCRPGFIALVMKKAQLMLEELFIFRPVEWRPEFYFLICHSIPRRRKR